jgi:hypothetical protein
LNIFEKTWPRYPLIITLKIIALTNITLIETSKSLVYILVYYLIYHPPLLCTSCDVSKICLPPIYNPITFSQMTKFHQNFLSLLTVQISIFRLIRGLIRDGGGISRLQVPVPWPTAADYDNEEDYELEDPKSTDQKDPSKWREVNCPKEIEFLLRLRNQRHFGQAETDGTPFTGESMKHKFNWSASTNEAKTGFEGRV